MANRAWFYAEGGQQQGPFLDAPFRDLIANGIVRADTLIWTDGMAGWQRAGDIPGLLSMPARPPTMSGRMPLASDAGSGPLSIDLPLWPFFGRCLLLLIGNALVVPSPWTTVSYYRWITPRFYAPGRSDLAFEGKLGDIWHVIVGMALLGYAGQISHYLQPVAIVGQALLFWMLLRWAVSQISSGARLIGLELTASIWAFVGWQVLAILSMLTVIGWAWVATAWLRWICRNIDHSRRELTFNRTGIEFLWRTLVTAIGCVFLVPIPWVLRWYTQWCVSQLALVERGA